MVAKYNLSVYQGADYRKVLELKDESSALIDLTGYTFRGQVKSKYADSSPVFSFAFSIRDQVASKGLVDMNLSASDTASVSIAKETNYIYDVEMVDSGGIVRRLFEGKLQLFPEVTK